MSPIKVALVLTGTATTLLLFKEVVVPFMFHCLSCTLPSYYQSLQNSLTSLHPCIVLSIIIVAIICSSRLETQNQATETPYSSKMDYYGYEKMVQEEEVEEKEVISCVLHKKIIHKSRDLAPSVKAFKCFACLEEEMEKVEVFDDKHVEEGSERSMDEVWKMIMEEKKKEERLKIDDGGPPTPAKLRKCSGQVGEQEVKMGSPSFRQREEMSSDELKIRVEEFINKVNQEMKLQR